MRIASPNPWSEYSVLQAWCLYPLSIPMPGEPTILPNFSLEIHEQKQRGLGFGRSLPKDWCLVSGFLDSCILGGSGKGARRGQKWQGPLSAFSVTTFSLGYFPSIYSTNITQCWELCRSLQDKVALHTSPYPVWPADGRRGSAYSLEGGH